MNPEENVSEDQVTPERELTPEEQEQAVAENKRKLDEYVQNMFLQEWWDISADFNKSNKNQVDITIQRTILECLTEYLWTPVVTMKEAFEELEKRDLHLNVEPSKKEFWSYGFKIALLKREKSFEYSIKLKTTLDINPL